MRERTLFLATGCWIALLCTAIALSLLAAANDTLPGDRAITAWLQDQPFPGRELSDLIRVITGTEVVLATGASLSLILWLRGYRRQAVLFAAGLVLLPLLQFSIKGLVDRPRPHEDLVDVRAGFSSESYPSGHVMSGTYLYTSLSYLALTLSVSRLATAVVVAISLAIVLIAGPANVWLGVHWPSDVLGGWLWYLVLLLPLFAIDRTRRKG
jgi:undecaprenyl-diphosphatase